MNETTPLNPEFTTTFADVYRDIFKDNQDGANLIVNSIFKPVANVAFIPDPSGKEWGYKRQTAGVAFYVSEAPQTQHLFEAHVLKLQEILKECAMVMAHKVKEMFPQSTEIHDRTLDKLSQEIRKLAIDISMRKPPHAAYVQILPDSGQAPVRPNRAVKVILCCIADDCEDQPSRCAFLVAYQHIERYKDPDELVVADVTCYVSPPHMLN